MNNADMPAMAFEEITERNGSGSVTKFRNHKGLTKREHFAAMAMQGFLSSWAECDAVVLDDIASDAVGMADALLKALEQES
tara:strand:+ start:442 stop:684 length:243 start_codon:yes stop_codon:yes gene_type:complete